MVVSYFELMSDRYRVVWCLMLFDVYMNGVILQVNAWVLTKVGAWTVCKWSGE